MRKLMCVGIVGILTISGCRSGTETTACPAPELQALSAAASSQTDWRAAILDHTSALSPDSPVEGTFWGISAADSVLFTPFGGRITYAFQSFRAASVAMSAGAFRAFASDPQSDPDQRITKVQFGQNHIPFGCR